jgi:hypothetical protein
MRNDPRRSLQEFPVNAPSSLQDITRIGHIFKSLYYRIEFKNNPYNILFLMATPVHGIELKAENKHVKLT